METKLQSKKSLKKIARSLLAGLLLSVFFSLAAAQPLTLEALTERALTANRQILSAWLDLSLSDSRVAEVRAATLPQIRVDGDYRYYTGLPVQLLPASFSGGPENAYIPAAFGVPANLSNSVAVSQLLYSPEFSAGLRAARAGRRLSELQVRQISEEVAYQTAVTFYRAQTLAQQMEFLRGNAASLGRLIEKTELLHRHQLTQGTDVNRLRLTRTSLLTQLSSVEAAYDQLLDHLKLLAGIPQSDSLAISLATDKESMDPDQPLDPARRVEWQLLEQQQELNHLQHQHIQASAAPSLALYGVFNHSIYGKAGDDGLLRGFSSHWIGLRLSWKAFDGFGRQARLEQKRIEELQLDLRQRQLAETISLENAHARNQVEVQLHNLQTSRQQIALAEQVYQQTQLQFREGLVSITEIIEAENALREAQNDFLTSLIRLRSAQLDRRRAAGNLIGISGPFLPAGPQPMKNL